MAWLFLSFKSFEIYKIKTFQAIVINYLVCVPTGIFFSGKLSHFTSVSLSTPWLPNAIILGAIFISTFYIMAITAQKAGVSTASVANRVSFVLPVLFSLFFIDKNYDSLRPLTYVGLFLVIPATILSSYKSDHTPDFPKKTRYTLVFIVVLMSGLIDIGLKYTEQGLSEQDQKIFPIFVFFSAFCFGALALIFQLVRGKQQFQLKSIWGGLYLGIPNYFSLYFILKAINHFPGSLVFSLLNIGIIISSTFLSIILFKEKLSKLNYFGIAIALIAIYLIL